MRTETVYLKLYFVRCGNISVTSRSTHWHPRRVHSFMTPLAWIWPEEPLFTPYLYGIIRLGCKECWNISVLYHMAGTLTQKCYMA